MPLTITDVEVKKDMPDWQGKGAKVYIYSVDGDDRRPEDFVPNDRQPLKVGDTIDGIEDSDYGPKVKKQRKGGGGGFQKSPAQEKRIVRQHSQEQALRMCAVLGYIPDEETFREWVNWYEDDAFGKMKSGTNRWPLKSDIPIDNKDLF